MPSSSKTLTWIVSAGLLVGCSNEATQEPAVGNACGQSVVRGSVAGESVSPVRAASIFRPYETLLSLVLDESPVPCRRNDEQRLAFGLCDIEPRTYTVQGTGGARECAGAHGRTFAVMEDAMSDLGGAPSGELVIERVDGGCVFGSFALAFEGEPTMVEGTFAAEVCEGVSP